MEYYFCSPLDDMVRVFLSVHEFKNLVYALQYSGVKSELGMGLMWTLGHPQ